MMKAKYSRVGFWEEAPPLRDSGRVYIRDLDINVCEIDTHLTGWAKFIGGGTETKHKLKYDGYRGMVSLGAVFIDIVGYSYLYDIVTIEGGKFTGGMKVVWFEGDKFYPHIFNISPFCVAILGLLKPFVFSRW